jgi:hypothetical protein
MFLVSADIYLTHRAAESSAIKVLLFLARFAFRLAIARPCSILLQKRSTGLGSQWSAKSQRLSMPRFTYGGMTALAPPVSMRLKMGALA